MEEIKKKIRSIAKELLEKKEVEVVIGFEEGSVPFRATPLFARKPEDADRFTWNPFCWNNLAYYLTTSKGKAAVVAKGCDVRSIVGHIKENQLKREDVAIIGVPCEGMLSHRLLEKRFEGKRIGSVTVKDSTIEVSGDGFSEALPMEEYLLPNCRECAHPEPVTADHRIEGKSREAAAAGTSKYLEDFKDKTENERWEYFRSEVSRCIRCYACRNACPLCYCKECFVDHSMPKWLGSTFEDNDLAMYQVIRVYHTAGRCIDCGSCAAACPMDIDIRLLTRKICDDVRELFDFEAGVDIEGKPPLQAFSMEDVNEGFL